MRIKTKTNRFLSLFMAMVMLLSLLPGNLVTPAAAAEPDVSTMAVSDSGGGGAPEYVTLSDVGYADGKKSYQSPRLGECWFHQFKMDTSNGETVPGFCLDHTKAMGTSCTGQWVPSGVTYGPYDPLSNDPQQSFAALPYLAWYYYHTETEEGDNWNGWTRQWTNAWIQCALWLAKTGQITNVYMDEDKGASFYQQATQDVQILAEERTAALAAMGITASVQESFDLIRDLARGSTAAWNDKGWAAYLADELVWHEYKYTGGVHKPTGKPVQEILIPVRGGTPLGKPGYISFVKTDETDATKSLAADFTVYSNLACTDSLTKFSTVEGAKLNELTSVYEIPFSASDPAEKTVYLKETTAPDGYTTDGRVYAVTVSNETNSSKNNPAIVSQYYQDGQLVNMDTAGVITNGKGNSYVIYNWNLPGTKSIRSNGSSGASIGTGALMYETEDNGALGVNGIPTIDVIDKCQGNVPNVTVSRDGQDVTWKLNNGEVTFTWLGWFTDPSSGQKVSESMKFPTLDDDHGTGNVSEPVTYYGRWSVSSTLPSGGGSESPGDGETTGQFFTVYWDYQSNLGLGGGATACLYGSITIRVLTSISGGGMSPVNPTFTDYKINVAFSVPDDPANYGYVFKGWSLGDVEGKGTLYQKSDAETMAGLVQPGSTFFAIWEPDTYTVAYDANGGSGAPASQTMTFNKAGSLQTQQPTREGYNFIGWSTSKLATDDATEYSGGQLLDAQQVSNLYTHCGANGTVTLYAVWEPQRVIVQWLNTQYSKDFSQSTEYDYGDSLIYIGDLTNTEGYIFDGWLSDSGVTAANGLTLDSSILTYVPNADEGAGTGHGGYWTITFNGQWHEEKNSYTAYVLWLDDSDNDRVRPKTVDLFLTENSTNTMVDESKVSLTASNAVAAGETIQVNGQTYTSDGQNVWSYTWEDLPITWEDTTTNFVYSLYLAGADSQYGDYAYGIDDVSSRWSGTVVMTHKLITRNIDVQAVWDDQSDNDNLRPDSIAVSLWARYSDNSGFVKLDTTDYTVALTGDGDVWNYTFKDLRRFMDGYEIRYSIRSNTKEDLEMAPGDLADYDMSYKTDTIVYLSHENILQDVTGTVIWNDASNRDGHRPENIRLQLYKNGLPYLLNGEPVYAELTENGSDTWTYTFEDVEQLEEGDMSEYSVRVVDLESINAAIATKDGVPDAYRADYSNMTVVMSHEICRSDVTARVYWDDHSDQDGYRPDQVYVELYADGVLVPGDNYKVLIDGDGDMWTYTFGDMPEYTAGAKGQETVYTIKVVEVNEGELYGRYILTGNALNQNKVKYTAAYEEKEPIATLTHEIDTTTRTLSIEWGDDDNNDNSRPDRVLVSLYKSVDGTNWTLVDDTFVLTATPNNWRHTVSGLDKYTDGGTEIQYRIGLNPGQSFVQENGGTYASSVTGTMLRLVRDNTLTYVTARVDWEDNEDQDNIRPTSLGLELYAKYGDAEPVLVANSTMIVTEDTGWATTWTSLPLMSGGKYVEYSVKVVGMPDGYEALYASESSDPTGQIPDNILLVQMVHDQKLMDREVKVVWNDNSNNGGKRPASLPVAIYANGVLVPGSDTTLTTANAAEGDGNTWTYTYKDLPVNQGGAPIDYTVAIYGAYENSASYTELTAGLTLYMSMQPITQDLDLNFYFDDNSNADGARPTRLKITLTANGETVTSVDPVTITRPDDGAKDAFYKLPIFSAGTEKINYGVVVEMLAGGEGYTYDVTGNGEGGDTAVLSEERAGRLDISFGKERDVGAQSGSIWWYDSNNQWNNRPETLTIYLWNDKTTSRVGTYTLNVTENDGVILKDAKGNTLSTGEGTRTSDSWTYTIPGLPVSAQGELITYRITVAGSSLDNFYPNRVDDIDMDASLTMRGFDPTIKEDFRVNVTWIDNENAWNTRENVIVTLYANGEQYKTVDLTPSNVSESFENVWTYTWEGLPTYLDGKAVTWTAGITDLDRYTEKVIRDNDGASFTMTQCFGVDFTVNWDDMKNDDGVRPESLDLEVYGQGSDPVATVTITGEPDAEVWTASVRDLPVWKSGVNTSEQVAYSFAWEGTDTNDGTYAALVSNLYASMAHLEGSDQYDREGTFYHFTGVSANSDYEDAGIFQWSTVLTRDKEQWSEIPCTIVWDDDGDRDGLRPESIKVQLLADGVAVGDPVEVTGDMDAATWTVTWKDLDKYVNLGTDVTYTIELVDKVPEYTDTVSGVAPLMTTLTMHHELITFNVVGTIVWDDDSQLEGNITRTAVEVQFYCNGEPVGEPISVEKPSETTKSTTVTLDPQYVYSNHGVMNEYTIELLDSADSDPTLSDLIEKGYTVTYDNSNQLEPKAIIRHDYYDVSGYVYFRYNTEEDFLAEGAVVTVYLVEDGVYRAVGSGVSGADGKYYITGIPSGDLEIRAVYNYQDHRIAGKTTRTLDRIDLISDDEGRGKRVDITLTYDAANDDYLYKHNASGRVLFEQATVGEDGSTINTTRTPAANANVLVYKVDASTGAAQYVTLTTTGEDGTYTLSGLEDGTYQLMVYVTHEGAPYTYDNTNAVEDGLSFPLSFNDAEWADIVIKLPSKSTVNPPDPPDPPIEEPEPEPCVVDGYVYYEDNGVHTTDPVSGVDVFIYDNASQLQVAATATDTNGHFEVEGIQPGTYTAVYSYAGHASRVQVFTITEDTYNAGKFTVNPVYFARKDNVGVATISGTILDDLGNPYDVLVYVYKEKADGSKGDLSGCTYTDEFGHYEFRVAAGSSYLVEYRKIETTVTTEVITYPATGKSDVHLDYYTVSGVVTDDSGSPVSGAVVNLYYQEQIVRNYLTGADGAYSITNIAPESTGKYTLEIFFADGTTERHYITLGYDAPVVTATGSTYSITGTADAGTTATLKLNNSGVITTAGTAKVAADGTFQFTGLAAGDYEILVAQGQVGKTLYVTAPSTVMGWTYTETISGDVIDSIGPVRTANVTLLDKDGNKLGETQITLADGHYEFTVPNGTYSIRVAYPTAGSVLTDRSTTQDDSYGTKYPNGMDIGSEWVYNLNAQGASGTVTDQEGRPIANAQVVLTSKDQLTEENTYKTYTTTTRADGTWYIGVPAGDYSVRGMLIVDASNTYYSNETPDVTVSLNTPVTNLTITRYELTGSIVRGGDNTALSGAEVTVTNAAGTVMFTGTSDDNGAFSLVLVPGSYTVTAVYHGQTGTKTVTVDKDTTVTVEVGLPYTMSGTVTNEDGTPASNAIIYYEKDGVTGSVSVNDDGTYSIDLGAGTYTVYASNGTSTSDAIQVVLDTDKTVDITLAVPESGYTVAGVVVDDQGNRLENAIVSVLYGNDKKLYKRLSTDSNGEFSIRGVPDNEYYLAAQWTNEGKTYVTYADTTVVVPSEGMESVVLTVLYREPVQPPTPDIGLGDYEPEASEATYSIDGTVLDEDGNEISGATVYLYSYDHETKEWTKVAETTSDADGYYIFEKLVPGIYRVDISYEASKQVEAVMGNYVVSGYAVDEDGNPYAGARVDLLDENGALLYWDTTSEDGYYEFAEIPSGHYQVRITPADSYTETDSNPDEAPDTYKISGDCEPGATVTLYDEDGNEVDSMVCEDGFYEFTGLEPGNYQVVITPADETADEVVKVIALGDATIEVTESGDGYTINGVVLDADGNILTDSVRVELSELGGTDVDYFNTQDNGEYVFYDVAEGVYTLTFIYGGETRTAYVDCTSDPLAGEPDTVIISGIVLDEDGNEVEGALVKVLDGSDELDSMTTEADGEYRFTVLAGGDYSVEITYPDSNSFTQVLSNLQNLPTVIEQPDGLFRIEGKVVDQEGNGVYQARIHLYQVDGTDLGYFRTYQDGSYSFSDLEAGSYYLETDGDRSTRVYVEATSHGPSSSADGSYTISGVARDSDGNPVEGAQVEVRDGKGNLVISAVTDATGVYNFTVEPGTYDVSITYPSSGTLDTAKGDVEADSFNIYGFVVDEEGTKLEGVTVALSKQEEDGTWTQMDTTLSDALGYYEFSGVPAGTYLVEVGPYHDTEKEYEITVPGGTVETPDTKPDPDPEPEFPEDKITLKGKVQTNNGHVLSGAEVFIVDEDSSPYEDQKTVQTTKSGADGSWALGNFETGHYTIYAQYTHKYGMNQSAADYVNFHVTANKDDFVLTITLSYTKDVNGDGVDETVYAGLDDEFDTADDFYVKEINGEDEKVYPGKDLVIGTKDDEWFLDVDGDGKDETIYVGEDRIAGTEDDFYLADPDKDGEQEPIYAGPDKTPGTDDDWWPHDVDGDGTDEVIHVGPDAKPGTEDDWYEWDIDKDGKDDTVIHVGPDGIPGTEDDTYTYPVDGEDTLIHVGPDGIPGTEDDWYEKDMDGDGEDEKVYVGPDGIPGTEDDWWTHLITFNANGGTVNGEPVLSMDKTALSTMPSAIRSGHSFNGWYTAADGGYPVTLRSLQNATANTTVYAHWTETEPTRYVATFDANGGTVDGRDEMSVVISTLTSLPTAVRKDYSFDGWFTRPSGGSKVTLGDLKAATSDMTIYAHWTKKTPVVEYEITFNANGGRVKGDSSYTTTSNSLRSLPTATRSGYTFDGWYSSRSGGSLMTLAKLRDITDDMTVYAHWTEVKQPGGGGGGTGGGGGNTGGGGGGGGTSTKPTNPQPGGNTNPGGTVVQPGVDDMLITDDHFAYLQGYTDGSFGPDRNMTRGEAAQMFYNLLRNRAVDTTGISYKDVPENMWCATAIKTLTKVGVVAGYGDGNFGPDDPITRAQFATMTVRFLSGSYDLTGMEGFKDVSADAWYYKAVLTAAKCGWVNGYGNGYFGPNDLITRAQVTTMVNNMLGRKADEDFVAKHAAELRHFPDVQVDHWFYLAVVEATNAHDFYKDSGLETAWTSLRK